MVTAFKYPYSAFDRSTHIEYALQSVCCAVRTRRHPAARSAALKVPQRPPEACARAHTRQAVSYHAPQSPRLH